MLLGRINSPPLQL